MCRRAWIDFLGKDRCDGASRSVPFTLQQSKGTYRAVQAVEEEGEGEEPVGQPP